MFTLFDLAEVGAGFAAFFTTIFVLVRSSRQLSANLFVLASASSAVMWGVFIAIIPRVQQVGDWQHGLLTATASATIGTWLLFLAFFAREPVTSFIRSRSFTIFVIMALLLAASISGFFVSYFELAVDDSGTNYFFITTAGKYLLFLYTIAFTFGLLQIENTFRASSGALRRSLIFPLILSALTLVVPVVSTTLGLLYSRVDFVSIQLAALLMIAALVALSRFVVFEDEAGQGVVVSREAVYSSVAVLLVGAYLIVIGVVVKALLSLGGSPKVFLSVLAAIFVVVILVALPLLGSIRERVNRALYRSMYGSRVDVATELSRFSEDVTAATDVNEMYRAFAELLTEKCDMKSVSIFLCVPKSKKFYQAFPAYEAVSYELSNVYEWLLRAGRVTSAHDFWSDLAGTTEVEQKFIDDKLGSLIIPLVARRELAGFVTCIGEEQPRADVRFLIESTSHQLALSLISAQQSEALLEARELASFTKVSSFVVHDVKNLISMLSMVIQNFERKADDPRFQRVTMDTLQGAQTRMRRLINRLSAPKADEKVALSNCDLTKILIDLTDELKLADRDHITLIRTLPESAIVLANEEKLRSVLTNLLINAVEAMPKGGKLTVTIESDDRSYRVAVSDTGVGMSSDFIRTRLFRPFQTSKDGGLGIGLFQSRDSVEQMGGELTVVSEEGKGSRFTVRLSRP